jgi:hypothetical protein
MAPYGAGPPLARLVTTERMRLEEEEMKRFFGVAVASVLAVTGLWVVPASAVSCEEGVAVETLRVSVRSADEEYRVGETAVVKVRVQREVRGRRQAAEGVEVALRVDVRDTFAYAAGVTDHHGLVTLKVDLDQVSPGVANGEVLAKKAYAEDLPCHLGPREEGHAEAQQLFLVRPAD